MLKDQPFLPIVSAVPGRKTETNLFGSPEVAFPLLTKAQKATIRRIREQRLGIVAGRDAVSAFASIIGLQL